MISFSWFCNKALKEQGLELPSKQPLDPGRTAGVQADYAAAAVGELPPMASHTALLTLCGEPGSLTQAFQSARKASADGTLVGEGFPRRARRIHPFTLLKGLLNQTPAVLSINHQIKGPYSNYLADADAFVYLWFEALSLVRSQTPVCLVIAEAASDREGASMFRAADLEQFAVDFALALHLPADLESVPFTIEKGLSGRQPRCLAELALWLYLGSQGLLDIGPIRFSQYSLSWRPHGVH